jgi:hypothetical protein
VASGSAAEHRCDLPIGQQLMCRVFATKSLVFSCSCNFWSKAPSVRQKEYKQDRYWCQTGEKVIGISRRFGLIHRDK